MAEIVFYEKPGCAGNARQRRLLEEAGHRLTVRDLLAEPWTMTSLRPFFGDRPVADWFNRAAPAVKSGAVVPEAMDEDSALAAMLETPLLIRRPLMQVGEERACGFEAEQVDRWVGLGTVPEGRMEGCVRPEMPPCPAPAVPAKG